MKIITYPFILVILILMMVSSVFAWHEELGITDERATEIYNDHTLSPQTLETKNKILDWNAGLQNQLDFIDLFCFEKTYPASSNETHSCLRAVKTVYDNCFHHPGVDEECRSPELEKYMIQNNISGTYDANYTKIEPSNSSALSIKESRADIINKMLDLCIATGLDCSDLPTR